MKALLWFGVLLLGTAQADGANFYAPLPCPVDNLYLQVQNPSLEAQSFWIQLPTSSPFKEIYFEVKPQASLRLPLRESLRKDQTALALKTQNEVLQFKGQCNNSSIFWNIEKSSSPWRRLHFLGTETELLLHIANLSQQANPIEVSYESAAGIVQTESLVLSEDFQTTFLKLKPPPGTHSLAIRAKARWSGKVLTSQGSELPLNEEVVVVEKAPPIRYFLFESQGDSNRESFVVPMENPNLIQQSLEQIAKPESRRLLVARIEKSILGINRDFSSLLKSPWSWQVSEAQNYADFAHISCDGSPQLVEERLNSWFSETGGSICFWNYRIVRELSLEEIKQSPSWLRPALEFPPHKH